MNGGRARLDRQSTTRSLAPGRFRPMTRSGWVIFIAAAAAQLALLALIGWATWDAFDAEQRLRAAKPAAVRGRAAADRRRRPRRRPRHRVAPDLRAMGSTSPKHRRGGATDRDEQPEASAGPRRRFGSAGPHGWRQPPRGALSGARRRRRDAHSRGERAARGREEYARRPDVEADPGRSGVQPGWPYPALQSARATPARRAGSAERRR